MALAAAAAIAGVLLVGGVAYGGSTARQQQVVVKSGDTLWAIASSRYAGDDVQLRVAAIRAENHLSGAPLRPGQILTLPSP